MGSRQRSDQLGRNHLGQHVRGYRDRFQFAPLYLHGLGGEVFLIDGGLVAGEVAGDGQNYIRDAISEQLFLMLSTVSPNLVNSTASTVTKRRDQLACVVVVSTGPGTSQGSSIWQDLTPLWRMRPTR
ncbi:MAG: hypothetical protein U1G07_20890 [Verrucomicrobiota bacterium]